MILNAGDRTVGSVQTQRPGVSRMPAVAGEHHRTAALQAEAAHGLPGVHAARAHRVPRQPQQKGRLGHVRGDDVGPPGQAAHTGDQLRTAGVIGRAVIPQHRVHKDAGVLPAERLKKPLHQGNLLFAAQKSGVNGVKAQAQRLPVGGDGRHLVRQVQKGVAGNAAGLAGQHGGGQGTALGPHHGQHRQSRRQGAAADARKVVDGGHAGNGMHRHSVSSFCRRPGQISRRPSSARVRVTSSENSRWPPTGTP